MDPTQNKSEMCRGAGGVIVGSLSAGIKQGVSQSGMQSMGSDLCLWSKRPDYRSSSPFFKKAVPQSSSKRFLTSSGILVPELPVYPATMLLSSFR